MMENGWFWLSVALGIFGIMSAIRAIWLLAVVWQFQRITLSEKRGKVIPWIVCREIEKMKSEIEKLDKTNKKKLKTFEEFDEQRHRANVEVVLSRRRTATMAWSIWATVQLSLASVILGIFSQLAGN